MGVGIRAAVYQNPVAHLPDRTSMLRVKNRIDDDMIENDEGRSRVAARTPNFSTPDEGLICNNSSGHYVGETSEAGT